MVPLPFSSNLDNSIVDSVRRKWPHAPPHRTLETGTYMVTAATYKKQLYFNTQERLDFLHHTLLQFALDYGWNLQAWAVFANHYHFIAQSPQNPGNLSAFLSHLHVATATHINTQDSSPGRKVWFQFWDSRITYMYSYLARLNYVIQNPVRHGIVNEAEQYRWCSATWFVKSVPSSFYKTVLGFKIDKVNVLDDF